MFVAVRHNNISNLYISDREGTRFSLSLESIVYSTEYNLIDFYRVESLQGVYIATEVDPVTHYGQTVISFDKGAQWRAIEQPEDDSCQSQDPDNCRLHIHLDYRSVTVVDLVVGVVVVVGLWYLALSQPARCVLIPTLSSHHLLQRLLPTCSS